MREFIRRLITITFRGERVEPPKKPTCLGGLPTNSQTNGKRLWMIH